MSDEQTVITPEAILMYPAVFRPRLNKRRPSAPPKYSAVLVFPAGTDLSSMTAAAAAAGEAKWPGKFATIKGTFPHKVFKQAESYERFVEIPEFKGCVYISASNSEQGKPGVVDANLQPILDEGEIYSGCIVRAQIRFYGYDNESRGISIALENLMKVRDSKRFGGKLPAEQAFRAVAGAGAAAQSSVDDDDIPF